MVVLWISRNGIGVCRTSEPELLLTSRGAVPRVSPKLSALASSTRQRRVKPAGNSDAAAAPPQLPLTTPNSVGSS